MNRRINPDHVIYWAIGTIILPILILLLFAVITRRDNVMSLMREDLMSVKEAEELGIDTRRILTDDELQNLRDSCDPGSVRWDILNNVELLQRQVSVLGSYLIDEWNNYPSEDIDGPSAKTAVERVLDQVRRDYLEAKR